MRRFIDTAGYILVAALFTFALAVAARSELPITSEKPSQFIWQTTDGTYTNLPATYGDKVVEQFTPTRDRVTPVQRTAPVWDWAAAVPQAQSAKRQAQDDCRYVQLGNSARGGGVSVCGGEAAEVREQRVLRKGDTTTTTDTVLTIDGEPVFTVRGRSWTHDPSEVEVK